MNQPRSNAAFDDDNSTLRFPADVAVRELAQRLKSESITEIPVSFLLELSEQWACGLCVHPDRWAYKNALARSGG